MLQAAGAGPGVSVRQQGSNSLAHGGTAPALIRQVDNKKLNVVTVEQALFYLFGGDLYYEGEYVEEPNDPAYHDEDAESYDEEKEEPNQTDYYASTYVGDEEEDHGGSRRRLAEVKAWRGYYPVMAIVDAGAHQLMDTGRGTMPSYHYLCARLFYEVVTELVRRGLDPETIAFTQTNKSHRRQVKVDCDANQVSARGKAWTAVFERTLSARTSSHYQFDCVTDDCVEDFLADGTMLGLSGYLEQTGRPRPVLTRSRTSLESLHLDLQSAARCRCTSTPAPLELYHLGDVYVTPRVAESDT
ncbi:unnamed protein product [Symbiodinium microadriaticum]|nr:unnamed protein product [Symbiodinium microadriaticum]